MGAVLALALAVVAVDLSHIPKLWAYIVLALVVLAAIGNVFLLLRGGYITQRLFGLKTANVADVLDDVASDLDQGKFAAAVRDRVPALLGNFALFRARAFAALLLLGLLGELVLVVQVAALIEQTNAVKAQTDRYLERNTRDLFWQLHNDVERSNRTRAFRELLLIGQISFQDFSFRDVDLSGMNIPHVRFTRSDLSSSKFAGTRMSRANIERTLLRDSDFSSAFLEGIFDHSNFAGAAFKDATLRGRFNHADFAGADFTGADLQGISLEKANLTGATVSAAQLAQTGRLQTVIGVPDEVLIEVKKLNPELLKFWKPAASE